ncbi:Mitochondrial intermediate peptidase [Strongyloides ratti]|uniref:Mitochondrial intermediate peptidase n=1 Tax=Strongyloides ratti TaxID=34506 RepID=A0A090MZI6_STRRB|nr:Mitochondrial intermediate peptidase [Strongyloides ratti]CEF68999.1 Mitochondrial intermediate peptidase [Strongyloides ratti]
MLRFSNFLFTKRRISTGLFGVPQLSSPSGFKEFTNLTIEKSKNLVSQIINKEPLNLNRPYVALFDDISNEICKIADLAECVRLTHHDVNYASAAQDTMIKFTEIVESLNTNSDLYNALKKSLVDDKDKLDEIDVRTLEMFLEDFEQSGIHLSDEKKAKFVTLSNEIFHYGSEFTMGMENTIPLTMTERLKYGLKDVTNPCSFSHDQNVRKFVYNKYYSFSKSQEECLRNLIYSRHQLAQLTGYESFSERSQRRSILKDYKNVKTFLVELIDTLRPQVKRDLETLLHVLEGDLLHKKGSKVGEWDLHYLISRYKKKEYGGINYSFNQISVIEAIKGFEVLTKSLYDITFDIQKPEKGESCASNVIKLNVNDNEKFLGSIYIDAEGRPNKLIGDCHFTIRCGKLLESGEYQTPIISLSFSFFQGNINSFDDIKISFQELQNFFHEMGHAMHSMLGRTRYQHTAGTRCQTDMAEIPSNLMEFFVNDPRILKHVYNDIGGKFLSKSDIEKLISSNKAFSSFDLLQQSVYSLFDLEVHSLRCEDIINGNMTTSDLLNEIWNESLPELERDASSAWQHRFSHLIPYGAKYYSYLIAKASASLIWNDSFVKNPYCKDYGNRWALVQSHGGQYPSDKLLEIFLGYSPSSIQLADAIQRDL